MKERHVSIFVPVSVQPSTGEGTTNKKKKKTNYKTNLLLLMQNFGAPSFDDKKLEVVAVFGSMQMAMSRVINLQHHRITQV